MRSSRAPRILLAFSINAKILSRRKSNQSTPLQGQDQACARTKEFTRGDATRSTAQHPQNPNRERSIAMIRKLKSGGYRLYSRKIDPKTGRRRNLGTFKTRAAAEKHERAVQFFKRH